jgi:hypothetical protein
VAGVYSTRFILANGSGTFRYTVPPGKRAVIKCMTVTNVSSAPVGGSILLAGLFVWFGSVPGLSTVVQSNLTMVCNSGEALEMAANTPGMALHASGYLLDQLP